MRESIAQFLGMKANLTQLRKSHLREFFSRGLDEAGARGRALRVLFGYVKTDLINTGHSAVERVTVSLSMPPAIRTLPFGNKVAEMRCARRAHTVRNFDRTRSSGRLMGVADVASDQSG